MSMYIQDNVSQYIFTLNVKLYKLPECMKNDWACFIRDIHHIALGFKHLWSRFWTHGRWLALTKFAPTEAHPCESMWIHQNSSKFIKTYQDGVTHQANTVYWEFSIIFLCSDAFAEPILVHLPSQLGFLQTLLSSLYCLQRNYWGK